jgi:hypothetical protein
MNNLKSVLLLYMKDTPKGQILEVKVEKLLLEENYYDFFNVKDTWIPQVKESVYFLPGCTVPRFKARNKFKVTIKPEYSTSVFIPKLFSNYLKAHRKNTNYEDYKSIPTSFLKIILEEFYGYDHYKTIKIKSLMLNFDTILMTVHDCNALWHNPLTDAVHNRYPSIDDYYSSTVDLDDYVSSLLGNRDIISAIQNHSLININHSNIFCEDLILNIINEQNVTIDEKKYFELKMMLNSDDAESHKLAMELMANSNYNKSFIYLCMLLKEFTGKISNSKQSDHVNFKALLQYLDLDPKSIRSKRTGRRRNRHQLEVNISIEHFTSLMKKLGKFTRINVQKITQFYLNDEFEETEHYCSGPVLKPSVHSQLDSDIVSDSEDVNIPQL